MDVKTDPALALTIADLLEQSRAAHQRYRENCARMVPDGSGGVRPQSGNPVEARRSLMEASALRQGAEAADPLFASDAWLTEPSTHSHAELTAFYTAELAKDLAVSLTVETLRVIAQRDQFLNPIGPAPVDIIAAPPL